MENENPNESNPKPVRLLSHLIDGNEIEYDGRTFGLSENGTLISKLSNITTNQEFFTKIDCDIRDFISMAEDIPDDTYALMVANKALNKEKSHGRV